MADDLKTAALEWAKRGVRVLPLNAANEPLIAWKEQASTDPDKIAAMPWSRAAGIGGVPGPRYVVLDVDRKNGATLADVPPEGLDTMRYRTRSGGWHLWYLTAPGEDYGNGARLDLGAGLDMRFDRGYVALAPTPGYVRERGDWRDPEQTIMPAPPQLVFSGGTAADGPPAPGGAGPPIPIGSQEHELFRVARKAYDAGLDEPAVREAIRSTIKTRCVDQDPRRPWTDADVARIARPTIDTLSAMINSGRLSQHGEPEPEHSERRLKLLTTAQLGELPPIAFLLDDMLVERGFNVLAGPSGGGKSFLAIDMSCQLAVAGKRVVYVMAEGQGGAFKRVTAWARLHERYELPPVEWVVGSFDLLTDAPELLGLVGSCDLVVFDTLHRVTPGIDENSSQEMGRVIAATDYVRETAGAASLLVHHSGWNDERERGSSALRGAADAMLHLRPAKENTDDGDKVFELRATKLKEAESWSPRYYRIDDVPLGTDAAAIFGPTGGVIVPATRPADKRTNQQRDAVLDYIVEHTSASHTELRKVIGGRAVNADALIDSLLGERVIWREDRPGKSGGYLYRMVDHAEVDGP